MSAPGRRFMVYRARIVGACALLIAASSAAVVGKRVQANLSDAPADVVRVADSKLCSGVAVGTHRVLTAKHCAGSRHAEAWVGLTSTGEVIGGCVLAVNADHDLALIATADALPTSVSVASAAASDVTGSILLAGVSQGSNGWQGYSDVKGASGDTFTVDASSGLMASLPCKADSGGPAYLSGNVVGIASRLDGEDFDCATNAAEFVFVGDKSGWVSGYDNDSSCYATAQRVKTRLTSEGFTEKDRNALQLMRAPAR
ncbi:MAG: trypsin-like serine protease [Vicinamibacterales bacterium]